MNFTLYRRPLWATRLLLIALVGGCQSAPPSADPVANIQQATGIRRAVEFRVDGEDVDAPATGDDELTIADAAGRALNNSPELQSALARVRVAQADAKQTRLLPNPILSVAVRFPSGGGGDPVIEAGLAADLIAMLQTSRRSSVADARLRGASAEALSAALDVIAETQTTFVSVQALDAELLVLDARKKLIARLLDLSKARVEVGESSQLDVLTLNSERVALDVQIMEKDSDRRQQRLALARLLGEPSGRIDWRVATFEGVALAPTDERAWIAAAMEHRPELQARRWELDALANEAKLAGWAVFDGGEIGAEAERDDGWTVGPAISTPLPVFDWGQTRREKARAQLIGSRHDLVQTRRQIVLEVRQAIEMLTASQSTLAVVGDELIPLQQQRIAQAESAYRNGLADVTAVVIAEQESQESLQKLIELQQKVATAQYRLHRAVGGQARAPSNEANP